MKDSEPRRRERRPMTKVARRLRHRMTPSEQLVWDALRGKQCHGLRFLRQHDVGTYVLDFYCASAKLAVEIDGPIHETAEAVEHDHNREATLLAVFGIRMIRLTNEFVRGLSPEELRAQLMSAIAPPEAL